MTTTSIPPSADAGGDVTTGANIADNAIVRGDGGAKGIQDSGNTIADDDDMTLSKDLTFAAAAPVVLMGDGTGSPTCQIRKTDAGTGNLLFQHVPIAAGDWRFQHKTDENFVIQRHNGSIFEDIITMDSATDVIVHDDLEVGDDLKLTSGSPDLDIGGATGSPRALLARSAGGLGILQFGDSLSTANGHQRLVSDSTGNYHQVRVAGSWTDIFFVDDGGGNFEFRAQDVYLGRSDVTLRVGTGGGNPDILIVKDDLDPGTISFLFDSTTPGDGDFRLEHTTGEEFAIQSHDGVSFVDIIKINTTLGVELGASGQEIGFYGTTPVALDTGWTTFGNLTPDKTLDADSTTLAEVADVLGTLIEQLKTLGLISA